MNVKMGKTAKSDIFQHNLRFYTTMILKKCIFNVLRLSRNLRDFLGSFRVKNSGS